MVGRITEVGVPVPITARLPGGEDDFVKVGAGEQFLKRRKCLLSCRGFGLCGELLNIERLCCGRQRCPHRLVVRFNFFGSHGAVEQDRFLELPNEFAVGVIQILCKTVRGGEARRGIRRRFLAHQFAFIIELRHPAVVCCHDVMPLVRRNAVAGE